MILKIIYTIFIGILMATFVGVGIAAFYQSPKYPEYPEQLKYAQPVVTVPPGTTESAKLQEEQRKYDQISKDFQEQLRIYNRNVSIIALVFAILILVISLAVFKDVLLISDGLLLGGVLTLGYSIIRGFEADDNMFRFVVVSIGLIVSLTLGYLKFIKPTVK